MVASLKEFLSHVLRILRSNSLPSADSFRRQGLVFAALNLGLISLYMLIKATFALHAARHIGPIFTVFALGFAIQAGELLWLYWRPLPAVGVMTGLAWMSVLLNALMVLTLTLVTGRHDNEYYVLMVVPLLQAAFTFRLVPTAAVILLCDFLTFFTVHSLHSIDEYIEAGGSSLIYSAVGLIVWSLVTNLREREAQLQRNYEELERTREKLVAEEKLATAGRLSSAIAHEIRNPVAMIAGSLAIAQRPGQQQDERQKMFDIAASEAVRLERLTTDFLAYARPRKLDVRGTNVADALAYVASIARAHADGKGVAIRIEAPPDLEADFDAAQLQQALLILLLNALEAAAAGSAVSLRARHDSSRRLLLDVINPGDPIPAEITARIFEPFFTTKPAGTGLGLAIARNIARSHDGDLELSVNRGGQICFTLGIPQSNHRPSGNFRDSH